MKTIIKIISIPFSILFYLLFFLLLIIFHPIQWLCLNIWGYNAHRVSVAILNLCIIRSTHVLGTTYAMRNLDLIPLGVPVIFASNHQSMFDIFPYIWFLRQSEPKFVSKVELGRRIPSISYNLNHGGSVLIDRSDPRQALPLMKKMGEYIELHKRSVVIFPEGTRSKDGKPKKFAESGLKMLCKYAPSAYVVPVTINNSWKVYRYGSFPLGLGNCIEFIIHPPIAVANTDINDLIKQVESSVISKLE